MSGELWNEIELKGPQRQKQTQEQNMMKEGRVKMIHYIVKEDKEKMKLTEPGMQKL